jgi:hypothetical protein
MQRHYPHDPFERFADDVICYRVSEAQAQALRTALARRFADCGLKLHPQKTKIVYCVGSGRPLGLPVEPSQWVGTALWRPAPPDE